MPNTIVTFDLTGSNPDALSMAFAAGGVNLTITSGLFNGRPDGDYQVYENTPVLNQTAGGIGMLNPYSDLEIAIDGDGRREVAIFDFDQVVKITSVTFTPLPARFNLAGDGSIMEFELFSDDFLTVTHEIDFGPGNVNALSLYADLFGIGADTRDTHFRIASLTVEIPVLDTVEDAVTVGDAATDRVIAVLANDAEATGIASFDASGILGTVTLSADGQSLIYNPGEAFAGLGEGDFATEIFTYTAIGWNGELVTETVTVTVTGIDGAVTLPDAGAASELAEDVTVDVLGNDANVTAITGLGTAGTLGSVRLSADGLSVIYNPGTAFRYLAPGQTATDSFTYTVIGADGRSLTETVTMTVTGIENNVTGTAGRDTITGTAARDNIEGLANNDVLNGENGTDILDGGDGNDTLNGGADNDTLLGGNNNDRLDGGTGADSMTGGSGNDTYVVDDAGDLVIEAAGGGTDIVLASIDVTLSDNVENLTLTGTAVAGTGNALANTIRGTEGANSLSGLAGNDRLYGEGGADVLDGGDNNDSLYGGADGDTLVGGAGNDRLYGEGGGDVMEGGLGSDSYYVDDTGDVVTEANSAGNDSVYSTVSWTLGDAVEYLILQGTADLQGTGNTLVNTLQGNAGNNLLSSLGGNDRIFGNDGNDTLLGGAGRDSLTGGAGADDFVFEAAGNATADRLADFTSGEDHIVLLGSAFGLAAGALDAGAFVLGTAALDADDRLIYAAGSGQVLFDADGSGSGAAQLVVTMNPGTVLALSDIFVI
jgi:VCBS repeat-containing protein